MDEFKSDGCSMWPDGNYRDCCVQHDYNAYIGIPDKQADIELFQCVAEQDNTLMAAIMIIGLFLFRPCYRIIKKALRWVRRETGQKE